MSLKVATITLNPAYDLVGWCDEVAHGKVNRVQTTGFHAAGKGINVARVLTDLGAAVTVGGFLGAENTEGFRRLFQQTGMTNRFLEVPGCTRVNVKLTEQHRGVTDLNFTGFTVSPADWQRFAETSLHWLAAFDVVCVSGSIPAGVALAAFTEWMHQVRRQCRYLVFDSSQAAFNAGITASPWLIKPNIHELEAWAGQPLTSVHQIRAAAERLHNEYGIEQVIISSGAKGALWRNGRGSWQARPPACRIVSTTGAGDAMVGGLIYGLLIGVDEAETLRQATALAALAVEQGHVGVGDRGQLEALAARTAVTVDESAD